MNITNEPVVSKGVVWSYGGLAVFIAALILFFAYAGFFTPMGTMGFVASIISVFVEAIMLLIIRSLYRIRYIFTVDEGSSLALPFRGGEWR